MPEKTLAEIPRPIRELSDRGYAALQQNNLDYAIAIFSQVLLKEPAFYDCREKLRVTQFKKAGSGSGFLKKMWGTASSSPLFAKGQLALRNNPLEAISIAEQILNGDPTNAAAHKMLAEAALAADLPRTAVLSLEIAVKNNPNDMDLALKLGEALTTAGQIKRAETVYEELQRNNPGDQDIAQALKNLAASRTMQEGGYEGLESGQGSYRDILKNKDEAVRLEQEARQTKTEDVTGNLILEYEGRLAQDPNNIKTLRTLAELFTEKKDFDKAAEYYQRIIDVQGVNDPSIEAAIARTNARKFDYLVSQLDPTAPDYAEKSAELQNQKMEFQLSQARKNVERYPNDLQLRFELGQICFKAGKIGDAIQELQKAQNNPHRRIQAMSLLGQCFAKRGINDLAARTLQNAIKEKDVLDEEKKELIYTLGTVFEKMNKREEAIEQFKEIYLHDSNYRDVGAKVDAYYSGQ